MRQFFSWRVWAALLALAGLAVGLKVVLPASASGDPAPTGPTPRTVQFISLVFSVTHSPDFVMRQGKVNGQIDFILDGQRRMHVYQDTPGEISCPDYSGVAQCVVLADLLGDAVVWFALVPALDGPTAEVPPIVELLDDGIAQLANGWQVPHASVVSRSCPVETGSLKEFIREFGPESTTIIDVSQQQIVKVRCSPKITAANSG